jgi:hypothetical protein
VNGYDFDGALEAQADLAEQAFLRDLYPKDPVFYSFALRIKSIDRRFAQQNFRRSA